jgi:hypothetical protein
VCTVKTHAEKLGALAEGSANVCLSKAAETYENACPGTMLKGRHMSRNVTDM